VLVQKHGSDALAEVSKHMQGRLVHDYRLAALWGLVAEAIRTMFPDARARWGLGDGLDSS